MPREILTSGDVSLDGSILDAILYFCLFAPAEGEFDIVTP